MTHLARRIPWDGVFLGLGLVTLAGMGLTPIILGILNYYHYHQQYLWWTIGLGAASVVVVLFLLDDAGDTFPLYLYCVLVAGALVIGPLWRHEYAQGMALDRAYGVWYPVQTVRLSNYGSLQKVCLRERPRWVARPDGLSDCVRAIRLINDPSSGTITLPNRLDGRTGEVAPD